MLEFAAAQNLKKSKAVNNEFCIPGTSMISLSLPEIIVHMTAVNCESMVCRVSPWAERTATPSIKSLPVLHHCTLEQDRLVCEALAVVGLSLGDGIRSRLTLVADVYLKEINCELRIEMLSWINHNQFWFK